ncbi:MAG TPA: hypothetical protein VE262_18945 [Blastocatellia bacterium]|nr:hypothetical protein [Blastocatellia bacterium]
MRLKIGALAAVLSIRLVLNAWIVKVSTGDGEQDESHSPERATLIDTDKTTEKQKR